MKLVKLDDVKCDYSVNTSSFVFSWHVGIELGIHKVVIVEIQQEDAASFKTENIYIVDSTPSQTMYRPRYTNDSNIHIFFIAGIADCSDNSVSVADLRYLCKSIDFASFVCTGFSGTGSVFWNVSVKGSSANISVKNSFELPSGFLSYSYEYCGIRFSFNVYRNVEKSNEYRRLVSFYVPKDAKNIQLGMYGTSVNFVQDNSNDKGLSAIIKRIFNKEKKNELF